jgi:group I intron endonuclease
MITSPSGRQYVGSTINFIKRWYSHKAELRKGTHHSQPLQFAFDKYGLDNLKFVRLLICRPADMLMFEQRAIDILKPAYNACPTAGNRLGTKHSDETRAKMVANHSHHPPSKYQIERIIQCNKERGQSPASRAKIAASQRGGKGSPGKRSPEFCAKISAIRMGKKPVNCFENIATDQEKAEIVKLYLAGVNQTKLKKLYHTKHDVISQILTAAGVKILPMGGRLKTVAAPAELIAAEYLAGMSIEALTRKFFACRRVIRRILIQNGVPIKKRGRQKRARSCKTALERI